MNLPRLFKLPEHKRFTYRPLFHDPEKEAKEERLRRIKAESGEPTEQFTSGIQRGTFKNYYHRDQKAPRQSNTRLILIIFFLLLLAYLLLFR